MSQVGPAEPAGDRSASSSIPARQLAGPTLVSAVTAGCFAVLTPDDAARWTPSQPNRDQAIYGWSTEGGALLGDLAALLTAVTAILALAGGYVQFVLRRALMPCVEFDVELSLLRQQNPDETAVEIICVIKNIGPGVGFVKDVKCRVRYRKDGELRKYKGVEPEFATAVGDAGASNAGVSDASGYGQKAEYLGLSEARSRYFIQPGVTQWYRKPLSLPGDVDLINVRAEFLYEMQLGRVRKYIAKVALPELREQKPGPAEQEPGPAGKKLAHNRTIRYTVRRTFSVDGAAKSEDRSLTAVFRQLGGWGSRRGRSSRRRRSG